MHIHNALGLCIQVDLNAEAPIHKSADIHKDAIVNYNNFTGFDLPGKEWHCPCLLSPSEVEAAATFICCPFAGPAQCAFADVSALLVSQP